MNEDTTRKENEAPSALYTGKNLLRYQPTKSKNISKVQVRVTPGMQGWFNLRQSIMSIPLKQIKEKKH